MLMIPVGGGGIDRWIPKVHWPATLAYLVSYRQERDPFKNGVGKKRNDMWGFPLPSIHTDTHMHVYPHTNTHKYAQTKEWFFFQNKAKMFSILCFYFYCRLIMIVHLCNLLCCNQLWSFFYSQIVFVWLTGILKSHNTGSLGICSLSGATGQSSTTSCSESEPMCPKESWWW